MESRVPQHIPGVPASIMVQPLLDSRVPYGRLQPHHHHHHHPRTIYPIDQMRSTHVENDYIDSPAAVVSQQPQQAKHPVAPSRPIEPNHHHHHHHPHHHHTQHSHTQDSTHPWINFSGRPSSISSSSSTSSDQRLLDHAAPTPMVDSVPFSATTASSSSLPLGTPPSLVRIAGTALSNSPPQSKLLGCSKSVDSKGAPEESVLGGVNAKHLLVCEHCGKCRCTECTMPRALPSCWVCRQSCLCSAQSLVDAATCMCLVRGVFYHCAEDDGDDGDEGGSCADRPCSCGPAHRCARWSFMTALSVALPCLLCYLPAIGCAKLSQRCYDAARRPGCRCKVPTTASATTAAAKTKAKAGVAGILGKAAGSLDKQAS